MWLQNLLFLGIVVCSISAPARPPRSVNQNLRSAIQEAFRLLNKSEEPAAVMNETVEIVPARYTFQAPTCLLTSLRVYQEGLPGSLHKVKGLLAMIATHFQQHCRLTQETSCVIKDTTFSDFKERLKEFLSNISTVC